MKAPVKILSLVSYNFLPPKMGGQKGIAFFNRYLSKRTDLYCVTLKENEITGTEAYTIQNILSNSPLRYINLFYFFTLRKIIREKKITHLILEHPYYGWLGILLKWFCRIKLIVHSHNIESLRFKSLGKWWWGILWNYEKITHKNANLNFFIQDNDKNYGVEKYNLAPEKCFTITYGFEMNTPPGEEVKRSARKFITSSHNINETEKILLFNGTLDYKPNQDALDIILTIINPKLLADPHFKYKIIICGNRLPLLYNSLADYSNKNIIYAGFVDDISIYFKGADIFINPVTDGGGIKTKLVEALGYNMNVVTTANGAIGIPVEISGTKMQVTADNDWTSFAQKIIQTNNSTTISKEFFDHFYWGNITEKAINIITG